MSDNHPASGLRRDPNWSFKAIGTFVPKAAEKCFERHGFHTAEIILNWTAIVGHAMARYTLPVRIRWPKAPDRLSDLPKAPGARGLKTALEIWVDGGRAHEIPYQKRAIVDRINAYFGYRAVTDINPISGPVPQAAPAKPRAEPCAAVVAAARAATAGIGDDGVRDALARLGASIAHAGGRLGSETKSS